MGFIKNHKLAIVILYIAIISLVMMTYESSWNAETSSKNSGNKDVSIKK